MEQREKQADFTGSGAIETPILASEEGRTEGRSKASPRITSTGSRSSSSDKPLTQAEGLSLLQTRCFDLLSLGLKVEILADDGDLFIVVRDPEHEIGYENGHFLLDGVPVVKG